MATKPVNDAEWASGGSADIAEPSAPEKALGWVEDTRPPAQYFNWWMKLVYTWVLYLQDLVLSENTWSIKQTFIGAPGTGMDTLGGVGIDAYGGISTSGATGGGGTAVGAEGGWSVATDGDGGMAVFGRGGRGKGTGYGGVGGFFIGGGNVDSTSNRGPGVVGITSDMIPPSLADIFGFGGYFYGKTGGVKTLGGSSTTGIGGTGGQFTGGSSSFASGESGQGIYSQGGDAGSATGKGGIGAQSTGGSGSANSTNGGDGVYGIGGSARGLAKRGGDGGHFVGGAAASGAGNVAGHGVVAETGSRDGVSSWGHAFYAKNALGIVAPSGYGHYLDPGLEIKFGGVRTNYAQAEELRNTQTAKNLVQHWGRCTTDAAGGVTINSGFGGWTADVIGTDTIRITYGGTFLGHPIGILVSDGYFVRMTTFGSSYFEFKLTRDGTTFYNVAGLTISFTFAAVGQY